jgi:hypothetical protein
MFFWVVSVFSFMCSFCLEGISGERFHILMKNQAEIMRVITNFSMSRIL